jgi:hypothetical protein
VQELDQILSSPDSARSRATVRRGWLRANPGQDGPGVGTGSQRALGKLLRQINEGAAGRRMGSVPCELASVLTVSIEIAMTNRSRSGLCGRPRSSWQGSPGPFDLDRARGVSGDK